MHSNTAMYAWLMRQHRSVSMYQSMLCPHAQAPRMCQADEYEKALVALGGLISGKKRSHGEKWQHAYEGMRVFLEVRGGRHSCFSHTNLKCMTLLLLSLFAAVRPIMSFNTRSGL